MLLALLVAAALALRLTGIGFLLPHSWEPESTVIVEQVRRLESSGTFGAAGARPLGATGARPVGAASARPVGAASATWSTPPNLLARLVTFTPRPPPAQADTAEEHLRAASREVLRIRRVNAVLSALIVPATWLLARAFLSRGPALFAAALVAFSLMQIWFAQGVRPHAISAAFAVAAVATAIALRRRPTWMRYASAFAWTILAACSLQIGFAAFVPLVAAHVLRVRGVMRRANFAFVLGLAAAAVSVRACYPVLSSLGEPRQVLAAEIAEDEPASVSAVDQVSAHASAVVRSVVGLRDAVAAGFRYEPLLCVLLVAGVAALVFARRARLDAETSRETGGLADWRRHLAGRENAVIVLAFVIPCTIAIATYGLGAPRFVLALVPFVATFGVYGLFALCERVVHSEGRIEDGRLVAQVAALAIVLAEAFVAVRLVAIRSANDTVQRAAEWITQNLDPQRDRIAHSASIDIPLRRTRDALAASPIVYDYLFPWIRYQRSISPTRTESKAWDVRPLLTGTHAARLHIRVDAGDFVRASGATYAVVEVHTDSIRPYAAQIREGLAMSARRVARFSPLVVDGGDTRPMDYHDDELEDRPLWWWRTISTRSMGPVLEVYRLDAAR